MYWTGWPIERVLLLFVGIVLLVLFGQVTLFHYRQNFRHWSMYIPVIATPIFGCLSLLLVLYDAPWLHGLLAILLWVGVVAGLYGTFMHVRGIGKRVDGYALRNVLVGPPPMLPGMVSAISVFGLIALHWR